MGEGVRLDHVPAPEARWVLVEHPGHVAGDAFGEVRGFRAAGPAIRRDRGGVREHPGDLDVGGHGATLKVRGEGGLYVKELAHGDEGRTEPSLATLLGIEVTVTALDVLAVEGEDEPFEDEAYFV